MIIIYAHPNKSGHCGYALKTVLKQLDSKNKQYEVMDLYRMNFDPVLKNEEHYTSGHREISVANKRIQDKISKERKFLVIYPTWWNSTPAILKGFFDRIFTSHYAFKYVNGLPRGMLKGKVAVITTSGGGFIIEWLFFGLRSMRTVVRDTFRFCGFKCRGFLVGGATSLTDRNKSKIEGVVRKSISYLFD